MTRDWPRLAEIGRDWPRHTVRAGRASGREEREEWGKGAQWVGVGQGWGRLSAWRAAACKAAACKAAVWAASGGRPTAGGAGGALGGGAGQVGTRTARRGVVGRRQGRPEATRAVQPQLAKLVQPRLPRLPEITRDYRAATARELSSRDYRDYPRSPEITVQPQLAKLVQPANRRGQLREPVALEAELGEPREVGEHLFTARGVKRRCSHRRGGEVGAAPPPRKSRRCSPGGAS